MKIIILCIFLLVISGNIFPNLKFISNLPFKAGEKLVLSISVLGVYIGDQEITIDDVTNYDGHRVIVGKGQLSTTPFISSIYKVDDREVSYVLPDDYIPVYYERWINEGTWHDNIRFNFYPDEHKVDYYQKYFNYDKKTIDFKGILRNYFTLIACMRSVDYDSLISNNENIEIDYLYGTSIKNAKFKPSFKKIRYKDKVVESIYIDEIGGIGMHFTILNDEFRTPIKLVIPAFEVIGFRTISINVELKEFKEGIADLSEALTNTNG